MNYEDWPQNVILSGGPVMNVCEELATEVSGPRCHGSYVVGGCMRARSDSSSKSEGLGLRVLVVGNRGGMGAALVPPLCRVRPEVGGKMNAAPPPSIGLPVYKDLSLEALLGQSYGEFGLIISDNVSTECTLGICRRHKKRGFRLPYSRQPRDIRLAPNHHFVISRVSSYYHADLMTVPEIALHGAFHQAPDWLHFRRDRCDTRPSACSPSTCGGTPRRSGVRCSRARIGESGTVTWDNGWPTERRAGPSPSALSQPGISLPVLSTITPSQPTRLRSAGNGGLRDHS